MISPAPLTQTTGVAHTRIYAYGAARGELLVDNDALVGPIDSSDEWIRQRTGIITRTRAEAGTSALDLATDAAAEAIASSGVAPEDIDLVIGKAAPEWPLERIAPVDRNILRLGLYELLFADRSQVPAKVAINEAIELAKTFGGDS
ncbi:MAG: transcription antitermination factor NusB, partial [Microbacterium sp.]|uniref:transcription antitermination factor NusB n=1 Tax=Microbacterium sp. TaxID=51671 RepID=UPI0027189590